MKILVIAPSWIGDVVMSQTLYKQLQDIYANCQIYVLAPKWCIDVLSRMPEVYQTITMPIGHGEFNLKKRYQIGKGLKAYNFDKAYILPNSWKSALIPLFAKIPDRYGFKGESRYLVINHLRTNKQDFPLLVERYCSLAFEINKVKKAQDLPKIAIPSLITHALSKEELTAFNITSTKLLGICPGAEYGPAKKWPPKYYAKVIEEFLTDFPDGQALIFGSQKDLTTANDKPDGEDVTKEFSSKAMLLLPQTVAAWSPAENPTVLENGNYATDKGAYFLVKCAIYNVAGDSFSEGDTALWGSTSEHKNVAIPVNPTWEQGKKYIYTFVFGDGGGYDPENPDPDPDDPDPVLIPVTFTVSVDDFVPVDVNPDIDMNPEA